jgi:hypothetical protein
MPDGLTTRLCTRAADGSTYFALGLSPYLGTTIARINDGRRMAVTNQEKQCSSE